MRTGGARQRAAWVVFGEKGGARVGAQPTVAQLSGMTQRNCKSGVGSFARRRMKRLSDGVAAARASLPSAISSSPGSSLWPLSHFSSETGGMCLDAARLSCAEHEGRTTRHMLAELTRQQRGLVGVFQTGRSAGRRREGESSGPLDILQIFNLLTHLLRPAYPSIPIYPSATTPGIPSVLPKSPDVLGSRSERVFLCFPPLPLSHTIPPSVSLCSIVC